MDYLLGTLAVLTAIAGLFLAQHRHIKAHPRKRLIYTWTSSPLITSGSDEIQLAVAALRGDKMQWVSVKNPYLFKIELRSKSDVPILEKDFSQSIAIETGAPLVARVGRNIVSDMSQAFIFRQENGSLVMHPCVIRPGDSVKLSALFDGKPDLKTFRGFKNVIVIPEARLFAKRIKGYLSTCVGFLAAMGALVMLPNVLFHIGWINGWLLIGWFVILAVVWIITSWDQ